MTFDSHLVRVLEVGTRLVNAVVPGEAHGRLMTRPGGADLVRAVRDALGGDGGPRPRLTEEDAQLLATTAGQLHDVFVLVQDDDHRAAARAVNVLMTSFGTRPQLDPDRSQAQQSRFQLHFHGYDDSVAVGWSAGFAAGLAVVIGSDLAGRIGVCAASGCDRVHVDTSRNNHKRFCSTTCQNRVKAAAFRSRRQSG